MTSIGGGTFRGPSFATAQHRRSAIAGRSSDDIDQVVVGRNTGVVRPDSTTAASGRFHLTAVSPGTTWVIETMDVADDSVQPTVNPP